MLFLTRFSFAACFNRGLHDALCGTLPRLSVSPHAALLKTFISTHIALVIALVVFFFLRHGRGCLADGFIDLDQS
ncbi:hypothetical protein COCCADRAFT_35926 [Bipolaris zeicola 26-R-13]|uniref:Uncharacterized protein n=1 Tax=Cochliobolus carbonum (strain 26-R-13) TaxID=930089 RepID=W6YAA0_COCC2|nr:uncharacterized protein COCCADRAFT_35926 [Bipolaris zeicola 26-R-13]EUC34475.1 hypothetical protein COCCADRAFT_35926 [Bipolaris zeicola 26-R-13]